MRPRTERPPCEAAQCRCFRRPAHREIEHMEAPTCRVGKTRERGTTARRNRAECPTSPRGRARALHRSPHGRSRSRPGRNRRSAERGAVPWPDPTAAISTEPSNALPSHTELASGRATVRLRALRGAARKRREAVLGAQFRFSRICDSGRTLSCRFACTLNGVSARTGAE